MQTVDIHEAETHLSRLVDQAAKGESFIIAKADKPLVKVTALDSPSGAQQRRLGFMFGQVPDDFDHMGAQDIEHMFAGDACPPIVIGELNPRLSGLIFSSSPT